MMKPVTSIVKEKVADHYFITLTMFSEEVTKSREETIFDNHNIDRLIKQFHWDRLLTLKHLQAYTRS